MTKRQYKIDQWKNLWAGLQGPSDKTQMTELGDVEVLVDEQLTNMWAGEGLGKKIVSKPADDMVKNWFTIPEDNENSLTKELFSPKLKTKWNVNKALYWMRLYGGSIIVMGIKDGRRLSMPVNINNIKDIQWLRVYPRTRVRFDTFELIKDPNSIMFEEPQHFWVQKDSGGRFKVHRSRCLVFHGEPIPDKTIDFNIDSIYWGMSILQAVWFRLSNLGAIERSIVNLMLEAVIGKYKIANLMELLAEKDYKAIMNRIENINKSKSIVNGVLLGPDEDYTRDSANMAGIPDIIDRFMMMLSAVTEIPVTILFGRSPAGENATGESDLTNYYDMIKARQEYQVFYQLQELVIMINEYVKATTDFPMIKFNPVRIPTATEIIEVKKKQAEIDKIYLDTGVLTPEDVQKKRFPEDDTK